MKQQIIIIHGASSFTTYEEYLEALRAREVSDVGDLMRNGWKNTLGDVLGDEYEVITPAMPNKDNAKYKEWEIWFNKLVPVIAEDAIFVGHSMGGIFLAKYFSENVYPKSIKGLFLVAAPYEDSDAESLDDFNFSRDCKNLTNIASNIFLYHSKDDPVVPYAHTLMYQNILPSAIVTTFEDRGHFRQESFPELARDIQSL